MRGYFDFDFFLKSDFRIWYVSQKGMITKEDGKSLCTFFLCGKTATKSNSKESKTKKNQRTLIMNMFSIFKCGLICEYAVYVI